MKLYRGLWLRNKYFFKSLAHIVTLVVRKWASKDQSKSLFFVLFFFNDLFFPKSN